MSYKMFIDDERFPIGPDWVICRDTQDVVDSVVELGFPNYISFDHDLGDCEETGYDLAKEFIDWDLDHGIIPPDFDFYVHSQNPIGKENIETLLANYLIFKKGDEK